MMVHIGIKELKAKLSYYVKMANKGVKIIVTDHGKEVALLVPISDERKLIKELAQKGKAKWSGGKPEGLRGISVKGKNVSDTILENRR